MNISLFGKIKISYVLINISRAIIDPAADWLQTKQIFSRIIMLLFIYVNYISTKDPTSHTTKMNPFSFMFLEMYKIISLFVHIFRIFFRNVQNNIAINEMDKVNLLEKLKTLQQWQVQQKINFANIKNNTLSDQSTRSSRGKSLPAESYEDKENAFVRRMYENELKSALQEASRTNESEVTEDEEEHSNWYADGLDTVIDRRQLNTVLANLNTNLNTTSTPSKQHQHAKHVEFDTGSVSSFSDGDLYEEASLLVDGVEQFAGNNQQLYNGRDENSQNRKVEIEEDSENDDGDNTIIENKKEKVCSDEKPITGAQTFGELLERELKREQSKNQPVFNNNGKPGKRAFLKKGEGLKRFEKGNNYVPKSKKPPKAQSSGAEQQDERSSTTNNSTRQTSASSRLLSGASRQSSGASRQPSGSSKQPYEASRARTVLGQPLKLKVKQSKHAPPVTEKSESNDTNQMNAKVVDANGLDRKAPVLTAPFKMSDQVRNQLLEKSVKGLEKAGLLDNVLESSFQNMLLPRGVDLKSDSELDAFEELEEAAENMSLSSNCSVVQRLLGGRDNGKCSHSLQPSYGIPEYNHAEYNHAEYNHADDNHQRNQKTNLRSEDNNNTSEFRTTKKSNLQAKQNNIIICRNSRNNFSNDNLNPYNIADHHNVLSENNELSKIQNNNDEYDNEGDLFKSNDRNDLDKKYGDDIFFDETSWSDGSVAADDTVIDTTMSVEGTPQPKPKRIIYQRKAKKEVHNVSDTEGEDKVGFKGDSEGEENQQAKMQMSDTVKEKLQALEREITKFRDENEKLEQLRVERDAELKRLRTELKNFDAQKREELEKIEKFKEEETKKLTKERKVFEQYQKNVKEMPNKREREEIKTLQEDIQQLTEELKTRETRWNAAGHRFRTKIAQLECENEQLKNEVKLLEQERLKKRQSEKLHKEKTVKFHPSSYYGEYSPTQAMEHSKTSLPTVETLTNHRTSISTSTNQRRDSLSPSNNGRRSISPSTNHRSTTPTNHKTAYSPTTANQIAPFNETEAKTSSLLEDGSRRIKFANGTEKVVSADSRHVKVNFFNGDVKEYFPAGKMVYFYAESSTTHTTYPDGTEATQFFDGQIERRFPDGGSEITFPDHTRKHVSASGVEKTVFVDGTVQICDLDGVTTIEFANGQKETHTQTFKRREYPNGTMKTVYEDGRQETKYANGRLRVKDKHGNLVIDTGDT